MLFTIFATSVIASYMQPVNPAVPQQQYGAQPQVIGGPQVQQPMPNQQMQVQQSAYPNQQMGAYGNIAAPATVGTPMNCKQILDPAFCKGPSMKAGYICSWQENECDSVDPTEPMEAAERPEPAEHPEPLEPSERPEAGDVCEQFTLNQAACQAHGCVFMDFECKPNKNGVFPTTGFNANGGHGVFPSGAAPGASTQPMPPAAPVAPAQPMLPAAPVAPAQPMPPAAPVAPVQPPPVAQPPATPAVPAAGGAPPAPTQPTQPAQPVQPAPVPPAQPARPAGPQNCMGLLEPQCVGPSMRAGELCMWDAEDYECVSASMKDMEAVCNQFYRDPLKCDQHQNCFWDEIDQECSEVKFGKGPSHPMPVMTQLCSNFRDVMSCASQHMCFWDSIANNNLGLCVSVIQAENLCRVLDTAIHCSTNALCHWQNGVCQAALPGLPGMFSHFLQKAAPEPASRATETNTFPQWQKNLLVGVGASVLGMTVGIFASWVHGKYQAEQVSNDDYRDIMMDIHSQRQVV